MGTIKHAPGVGSKEYDPCHPNLASRCPQRNSGGSHSMPRVFRGASHDVNHGHPSQAPELLVDQYGPRRSISSP